MHPSQVPPGFVVASHLQNTLDIMLGVLETIVQRGGSLGTPQGSHVRLGPQTPDQQPIPIYQGLVVQPYIHFFHVSMLKRYHPDDLYVIQ